MCKRLCISHAATLVRLQGIEKHGVGQWRDIGAEFLPRWDDTTLRLKAARLLGSQSLARYMRWRGDRCNIRACLRLLPSAWFVVLTHSTSCNALGGRIMLRVKCS